LGQALRFFRLKALQNREFQGCFPKTEVLGKPLFLHFFSLFLSFLEKGRSLHIGTLRPFFISPGIPSRVAAEKKPSGRAVIYNYAHGHKTYGGFFMKKSTLFLTAMAALIAVIFSALAGYASTGADTGGAATADAAAEKLAADLNASKAEGGTVRLTGRVEIKTGLTVPEGVTLDLTAEGAALELRDGAVLTVNGTVNTTGHGDYGKGWVEGSLRVGAGAAVINGSGTINLKSKGRLLDIGGNRDRRCHLIFDGVTLVGLPDNDNPLVGINENGAFTLKSGAITGNTRVSDGWANSGGVEVWRGTFTMEGGAVTGNTASGGRNGNGAGAGIGGGPVKEADATFTMKGGVISGNTATGGAGGEPRRRTHHGRRHDLR
jgi:hypothetical protein